MIGFYNYTVILTYMSLASSTLGMLLAVNYHFKLALLCLALSGLFDMFDGKVARTKKDRTDDEKSFGIQLDSLCDAICFGAFPVLLTYLMGVRGYIGIAILVFYVTAGVIRLGYYNVLEIKRQEAPDDGSRKYYRGLPITSISVILPLVSMLVGLFHYNYSLVLHCTMLAVGILFIVNFKVPKPKNTTLAVIIFIVALSLLKIFHIF